MIHTPDEQWHYERDGRSFGPLDRNAIHDLIAQNIIRHDTLVCRNGGPWIPAGKSELSHLLPRRKQRNQASLVTSPFVLILGINVIVFIVMAARGVGPMEPKVSDLLKWGANFGPRTTSGEWWRLLSSTFIHIGLLHLVFNMFVLIQIGPLMQTLMGRKEFTIAYFISGFAGSLASLIWHPYVVSAGASGAIFGLYGALLGFALVQRRKMPWNALSGLVASATLFIGYNVIYGLAQPQTDMAAHAGGLVGGFVCSLGLCASMPGGGAGRAIRNFAVTAVAAILMVVVAKQIPHSIDLQAELKQFSELESRTVKKLTSAQADLGNGKIKGNDFAKLVDEEVLPDWIAEQNRMNSF
ncbi:MAG TPA: rhomboid family intramembrane serine protease, partial [Terriglobia bacterium]|nr:rhomboid family intramembrane serine protease [Terriglobia bacterium]